MIKLSLPEPTPIITENEADELFKVFNSSKYKKKVKKFCEDANEIYKKHPF